MPRSVHTYASQAPFSTYSRRFPFAIVSSSGLAVARNDVSLPSFFDAMTANVSASFSTSQAHQPSASVMPSPTRMLLAP